jgi:hypothetical protein
VPSRRQHTFAAVQVLTTGFDLVDATSGAIRHGKLGTFRLTDLRATVLLIRQRLQAFDGLLERLEVRHPGDQLLLELDLKPTDLEGVLQLAAWGTTLRPDEDIRVVE